MLLLSIIVIYFKMIIHFYNILYAFKEIKDIINKVNTGGIYVKNYMIIFAIETGLAVIYALFSGLKLLNFLNGIFTVSMIGLCIGLFMMMYSDGAYSIMGHSFRKFNYMMAPKRIKETMDEDPDFNKELRIRQEKYIWTNPILFTSLGLVIISLIAMYSIV